MNLPRAGQSQPKGRIRPAGRKMPRSDLERRAVKCDRIQFYHCDSYARRYQNSLLESLDQLDIM